MKRKIVLILALIFGAFTLSMLLWMLFGINPSEKLTYGGMILCGGLITVGLLRKYTKLKIEI